MVKVGAAIDVSSKTSLSIPEPLSKIAYSKTKNAYA